MLIVRVGWKTEDVKMDQKSVMRSMDVSIPVGLSYEYLNVVLDARYHFSLTDIYKDKSWPTEKNKVFKRVLKNTTSH